MGNILGTKTTKEGKVIFEVELDYEEALQLKGYIKNIHVFLHISIAIPPNSIYPRDFF